MKRFIIRFFLLVILIAVGVVGYQVFGYMKLKDTYDEAMLYFEEQDYHKSSELFDEAMQKKTVFGDPLKDEIECFRAESYYHLGEWEYAITLYDQLIKVHPDQKVFYLLQGLCYKENSQVEEARQVFETGWDKTKDLDFIHQLCSICVESNDMEKAFSYIDVGMKEGSGNKKEFMFDKIVLYEKQKDFEQAFAAAEEYHERYPDDARGTREYQFLETRVQ